MSEVEGTEDRVRRADEVRVVEPVGRFTAFLVRGAIIGTGLVGVALFFRNSRLFARFDNVAQIPKEFVRREIELKGKVQNILPSGILKVEHEPLVKLPRALTFRKHREPGLINVRIAGLEVANVGTEFLVNDLRLQNKKIYFTVLKTAGENKEIIDADVTYKRNALLHTDINVELVRRGFARVVGLDNPEHKDALQMVPAYSRLISKLLMSEKIADRRGVGIWQRDTWVESVAAYPSQFSQMVKHSALTRFAVLMYLVSKDIARVGFRVAEHGYYMLLAFLDYMMHVYRQFAILVNRMYVVYNRIKQKLGR